MRLTVCVLAGAIGIGAPAAAQDAAATAARALREADAAVARAMREVHGAPARAYQGRGGPEQTERLSRTVRVGRDGRITISNTSGDITVTGGRGEEATVEAVKRTRGDKGQFGTVHIDIEEGPGRADIRATHTAPNDGVSVDFTVRVPVGTSVEVHTVSGSLKLTGVHGPVRAETVSGDVTASDTPKLETAKSVSGEVLVSGISTDGELSIGSVSGNVTGKGVKARGIEIASVSGDLTLTDAACDRLAVTSVSGDLEYAGTISKAGRYDINSHSGDVRLILANPAGFELNASSFSGSIRSELPLTTSGDSRRSRGSRSSHSMRATYGDGSAMLRIRTFSGDIVIARP